MTGDVTFDDAGLSGPSLPPLSIAQGRVELAGESLVLPDLPIQAAGGQIVLSGRVPLAAALPDARVRRDRVAPDESADVRIAWSGVRAEEWPQGGGETLLVGALDGTLAVTGGLASLAEVRARLEVPATTLRVEEIEVRVEPFGASLEDGRVQVEAVQIAAAGSAVRIEGGADLVRRQLHASALGALNLRALSPFVQVGALFGTAELDLSASGAWSAPDVRGTVSLEDASLRLRLLPQAMTSLQARIVFDGRSLRVPAATAVMGGGDLKLSGEAQLRGGLADAQFTITARDVTLAYPPGLRSRLEADLTLSGAARGVPARGGRARGARALRPRPRVRAEPHRAEGRVLRLAGPAADRARPARRDQNPIQVRNNMTDLQAVGAMTVRGDMNAPAPLGSLEIEPAGKVYLSGRAFEITSGRLAYRGNWDPTVEIEATDLVSGSDANNLTSEYEVTVAADRLDGAARPGDAPPTVRSRKGRS